MPTYVFENQKTGEIKEIYLPITLDLNSPSGEEAVRQALGISSSLRNWKRLISGGLGFTFTSAKTGRLNSAWMTEERQKARRLESDVHEYQRARGKRPVDWKDPNYKEAFSSVSKPKQKISKAAKETISRLSNEEVREFHQKHAPPGAKKK